MDIVAQMSDNVYHEFKRPSITIVWEILRNLAIPKLVGSDYCPVPYLEIPQDFDMFNVFTRKKLVEKVKKLIGFPAQLSCTAKLSDMLEYPTLQDRDILADVSVIKDDYYNIIGKNAKIAKVPQDFKFHTTSFDDKKEICLEIKGWRKFNSNVVFNISKAHINVSKTPSKHLNAMLQSAKLNKIPGFTNTVYVVTNVCAADSIDLNFRAQYGDVQNHQQWHIDGPVPIAIRLTKYKVAPDGTVKSQSSVEASSILDKEHWDFPHSTGLSSVAKCHSLKLHLTGEKSDATRRFGMVLRAP